MKTHSFFSIVVGIVCSLILAACGGSNFDEPSQANQLNIVKTSSFNEANATETINSSDSEIISHYADSLVSRASTLSAKSLTGSMATEKLHSVVGFIVKYKNTRILNFNTRSPNATLAPQSLMTASGLSVGALGVAQKNNLSLQFERQLFDDAKVFRIQKTGYARGMSINQAKKIADEMKASDPNIQYVALNKRLYPTMVPKDKFYASYMWALKNASTFGIKAETAWDSSSGSGVVVAVIDTGYRPHADFSGRILPGYDFISNTIYSNDRNGRDNNAIDNGDYTAANYCGDDEPASGSSWHGTHVAGTIAANTNNSIGIAGIAYNAKILPIRVLGQCGGETADIADAIIWASGGTIAGIPTNPYPAQIINMSLGGDADTYGECDASFIEAIASARANGTIVVVAAGNEDRDANNSSPANCSDAITVGATDSNGLRAEFSNYGNKVDISAPGVGILSTVNAGTTVPKADARYSSYSLYNGTSMATPHVAATLALMLSINPRTSLALAEKQILKSYQSFLTDACTVSDGCGVGILDASKAVAGSGITHAAHDFDGNGTSEILYKQTLSSYTDLHLGVVSGTKQTRTKVLSTQLRKSVAAIGDFNGDRKSDILESISATGVIANINYMKGTSLSSVRTVSGSQPSGAIVQGAADLNGDGLDDLILRTASGDFYAALMPSSNTNLSYILVKNISPNFVYKGSSDIDGDGNADVIWSNAGTGEVMISYMDGTTEGSTLTVSFPGKTVQGVGRFFKNTTGNILLSNISGQVFVATITDSSASATMVGTLSAGTTIADIGDYNGNGFDDILWRKTGAVTNGIWSFANNTVTKIAAPSLTLSWAVQAFP